MNISSSTQVASFVGAMLILVAYVAHQFRRMDARRPWYNALNVLGSGILAWIALRPLQIGFAILEVVWALVSLVALIQSLARPGETAKS